MDNTQKFYGDQLAKIAEFRTRAGELANYLEHLDGQPHDQATWCHVRNDSGKVCGTPSCALGHAVAGGLIPGAALTVLSNSYRLSEAGLDPNALQAFDYAYNEEHEKDLLFAVPVGQNVEGISYMEGYPTRNGTWIPWEEIGIEYYGAVVRDCIFYATCSKLDEVIADLREYAATGCIERHRYTYVHAAENDLRCVGIDEDGNEEDE